MGSEFWETALYTNEGGGACVAYVHEGGGGAIMIKVLSFWVGACLFCRFQMSTFFRDHLFLL